MSKYELQYICEDDMPESDIFEGSWLELQEFIKKLRAQGITNISAACVDDYS